MAPSDHDTRPAPPTDSAALAERLGVAVLDLEVTAVAERTPSMREVELESAGLVGFRHEPGQDLMLAVATGEGRATRRRYTIRSLDPSAGRVVLWVVRHGDGPAARWAASAGPGDHIEALGPRGKVTLAPGTSHHLFVGDETFAPAAFAMAEGLAAGATATIVLEVGGAVDELGPPAVRDGVQLTLRWVHRGDGAPGDDAGLLAVLGELALPEAAPASYLGGEQRVVLALRDALGARGVPESSIKPKAYWRRGRANADHGEPLLV